MTADFPEHIQTAITRAWKRWKMPVSPIDVRCPVIISSYRHHHGITTTLTLDQPALTVIFELIEPGKQPIELWRETYPNFKTIEHTWLMLSKEEINEVHLNDYELFFGDICAF